MALGEEQHAADAEDQDQPPEEQGRAVERERALDRELAVGDAVAPGDTVALLESMKMEIPVIAEVGGTVVAVKVTGGDVVQEGDVLITLERAG